MPLRIKCPNGHTLIVADDRAGRTLQCPRCNQPVVVPEPEADVAGAALLGVLSEGSVATAVIRAGVISGVVESDPSAVGNALRGVPSPAERQSTPSKPVVKPKSRVLPAATPAIEPAPYVEPTVAVSPELPAAETRPAESPPAELTAPQPQSTEPALSEPPRLERPTATVPEAADAAAKLAADPVIDEPEAPPRADVFAPPVFVPQIQPQVPAALHDDAARTLAAYWLSVALVAAALFSVAPAVWDVVEFWQYANSPFVARWALVLFFFGVVQLAYAVYLFQLPDWATVWVVTLFSLVTAGLYAGVLGLVLLSPIDGFLVGPQGLQLADKLAGGKAALWCVCMVSVSTILAFFAGKLSTRWRQAELLLRACS